MTGLEEMVKERDRQITEEGFGEAADREKYPNGELLIAARVYAGKKFDGVIPNIAPQEWPWGVNWYKPKSPRRNLVRAGALALAEKDRLIAVGQEDRKLVNDFIRAVIRALQKESEL